MQAAALIFLVFLITFPIYLYCIHTKFEVGYLFSFYVRRFVIQPLVVLLIIPMFLLPQAIGKEEFNLIFFSVFLKLTDIGGVPFYLFYKRFLADFAFKKLANFA